MTLLLATLEDLARARGTQFDPTDKQSLSALEGASALIRRETGRAFGELSEDDEVILDGTGTDFIVVPASLLPVVDVSDVTILFPGTDSDPVTLDPTEYRVLESSGILQRIVFTSSVGWFGRGWPLGAANVQVTMSHGYTADTIPADIRSACCEIALGVITTATSGGQTRSSESMGAYAVTYDVSGGATTTVEVPPRAQTTIDLWRLGPLR